MLVKANPAKAAAFDRLSATSPRFCHLERMFPLVWGVTLLCECVLRVFLAFTLPVSTMVWLSTVVTIGAISVGMLASSVFSVPIEKMVRQEASR